MASGGAIRAAKAFVEFSAKDSGLRAAMAGMKARIANLGAGFVSLSSSAKGLAFAGLATGLTAAAVGMHNFLTSAAATNSEFAGSEIKGYNTAWGNLKTALFAAGMIIAKTVAPGLTWMMNLATQAIPIVFALADSLGSLLVEAAMIGWQALKDLAGLFPVLLTAASEAFTGISQALSAGDWGLAANVAWLSLKLAWAQGVNALQTVWLSWKHSFLSTLAEALTFAAQKWHTFQNTLSKGVVRFMAFFDSSIDTDAVSAELDSMLADKLDRIGQDSRGAEDTRDEQFVANLKEIDADVAAARAAWRSALAAAQGKADAPQGELASLANDPLSKKIKEYQDKFASLAIAASKPSSGAQDLRTVGGQSQILNLINGQGILSQRQLTVLQKMSHQLTTQIELTRNGPQAVTV